MKKLYQRIIASKKLWQVYQIFPDDNAIILRYFSDKKTMKDWVDRYHSGTFRWQQI